MTSWMFKLADQTTYPDRLGKLYVYDNTHSKQVVPWRLVHLSRQAWQSAYAFLGHGQIIRIRKNAVPTLTSSETPALPRSTRPYSADFVGYATPLDIRTRTRDGRRSRARLGISDVNRLGMSRSVAKLPGAPV